MSENSESDKQYEPTQKKLDDARKKGEVPRSADLNTAASYAGFTVLAMTSGSTLVWELQTVLSSLLAAAPEISDDMFSGGLKKTSGSIFWVAGTWVAPWFAGPMICVLAAIVAQKSLVVAPSKLQPKLNKISILSNFKNKFGRRGFFEFFKSFAKLLIFSTVLGLFLLRLSPKIISSTMLTPLQAVGLLAEISVSFLGIVVLVIAAIGLIDILWQNAEHIRKNRMSRKEVTDEAKQMEGDPYVKQQRRQKAQEIATNQMLVDVPKADVIIVNPEHYAVALKWSRQAGSAPVCVAKGKGEVAARIRKIAHEYAVPIHRDPPTARALYASVGLGEQIHTNHFKAVAAAIRFAEEMRQKVSAGAAWK